LIRLFKPRKPAPLGHLETTVMNVLWTRAPRGEASVHDVIGSLERPLAYTTVMTTLDRLYKKGLLERRKLNRAFLYSPRLTRAEWEQQLVAGLVSPVSKDLLLSFLIDAAAPGDQSVLEELERKIREKRRELERRKKS